MSNVFWTSPYNQLKSLEALIAFKEDGVVDPESIAPYGYRPTLDAPGNVICRVHATRNDVTYWTLCQADDGRKVWALCQEKGLHFVGISTSIGLDEPASRVGEAIREAVARS